MRIIICWLIYSAFLTAVLAGGVQGATVEPQFALLTVEEAARPAQRSYGFAANLADSGPSIDVPNLEEKESRPFALMVRFNARDGAAPDLATLRVECLKSPVIDLTPRLKPYFTSEGVKIDRTTLPPGLHNFRVSVSDVRGRLSEKDFTILVSGAF
jgi:hypothetical protein